jgi:hypothetical protein
LLGFNFSPYSLNLTNTALRFRKRCGSVRWCVDYRALNALTIKDVFPLPLMDECLDTLAGNVWYSKLDANSAYWQVKIKPEDCSKTVFITKYGLFEFARMAFGLCNSPATYTRVINRPYGNWWTPKTSPPPFYS